MLWPRPRPALLALTLVGAACGGGDDAAPVDAIAGDSALRDGAVDAPDTALPVTPPAAPTAPRMTPCPPGWREVTELGVDAPTTCDPFPESGWDPTCSASEAHFPGEPGCAPVGDPCPSGLFPPDLPEASEVRFVHRAAAPGGDGSEAAPFDTIGAAIADAPPGAIVAVAAGVYEEGVIIERDLTLWGACGDVVLRSQARAGTLRVTGGQVTIKNVRISESREGVWAIGGEVTLEGLVVEDVEGTSGAGIVVLGGEVTVRGFVGRGLPDTGIAAQGAGSLTLSRAVIERPRSFAVSSVSDQLHIEDTFLLGADADTSLGNPAIFIYSGAATLDRVVIQDARSHALSVTMGATTSATDLRVVRTATESGDLAGSVFVTQGAELRLDRAVVLGAQDLAIAAAGSNTLLDARDVVVAETLPDETGFFGNGIGAGPGARVRVERALVLRATTIGVVIDGFETDAAFTDLTVIDTRPAGTGFFGRAVQVQGSATATFERVLCQGNSEASFVVAGFGTRCTATDLEVSDTAPRGCSGADSCPSAGIGIGAYDRAALSVARFRVADNDLVGLQLASEGELDAVDGLVENNPVGANVQVPEYDVARLTERVVYRNNGANLESEALPVPGLTPGVIP